MKHFMSFLMCSLAVLSVYAQGPNDSGTYYRNADGQKGKNLKTAFAGIISNHTNVGYDGLWECYKTSDVRPDGKIWDMYSNTTNYVPGGSQQGKNYSKEGDSYNREHSVPQSWFNEASPMKSDLVHVVPTDGYVNNRRSNYPFGENNGEKYMSNNGFSKLGACTTPGYSGTVFEPNDEYKGDFARIYFYMVTCYESKISSWNSDMFDGNSYPALKTWALNMLLRWAANDPVSQKEIDRNNAVYALQGNRNPFVDYPGLEQYVWGENMDMAFSYDNYQTVTPGGGGTDPDEGGETGGDDENPDITPAEGEQLYELVASADGLTIGNGYLIVYVDGSLALSSCEGKYYSGASVTITNNQIATEVDKTGKPHQLILGGKAGAYTFYDPVEKAYLSLNSSDNALNTTESATDNVSAEWAIYFSGDYAQITSDAYSNRSIQYNTGNPRFACYKSGQKPVSLFGNKVANSIEVVSTDYDNTTMDIYDLLGRKVATFEEFNMLPRGIYIISGRKVVKTR